MIVEQGCINDAWEEYLISNEGLSFFDWLCKFKIAYRESWEGLHSDFFNDWLNSDSNEFSGKCFYRWLLSNY